MKRIIIITIIISYLVPSMLLYGASAKKEMEPERGEYLAGRGIIIPPEEIYIDSYIAYINYNYPKPDSAVGINLYSGHRQISSKGQEEIIQVGIQGREIIFEDLTPMNLAFVIDKSDSMGEQDKIDWVKEAFDIFIERVRDKDYVSLIVFDDEAEVIFPSTQMKSTQDRIKFKNAVHSIIPSGGDDLYAGLMLGYQQIQANFREEYTNRVLLLSDGTEISARLKREGAKSGDIRVSLVWDNRNDLDLHVIPPSGDEIYWGHKKSFDGGELDVDMNAFKPRTVKPVENIYWPKGGAPNGKYKVYVQNYRYHGGRVRKTKFKVEVMKDGETRQYEEWISGTGSKSNKAICEFDYKSKASEKKVLPEILQMVKNFHEMGINVSTIGVGANFNLELMRDLADKGGGSSRFISGRKEMEKTFGSELDRMIVPEARDLNMKLEFLQDVKILGTWGYDNRIEGNTIYYYLPTLHHRDYETILVQIRISPQELTGEKTLACISLTFSDLTGEKQSLGPYYLKVNFVDVEYPVTGFSDGMVLQFGTMLHFAQSLKEIGRLYYTGQLQRSLDLTLSAQKELKNARLRLDNEGFDDEIEIMEKYIDIIGQDLELAETERAKVITDEEITPLVIERSLQEHIGNLFREMTLDLRPKEKGAISITGFTTRDGKSSDLITLLNEMAIMEIAKYKTLQVIERDRLNVILEEQKLVLSDLMDTENAIEIGKLLTANYILTGSVIETADSVVIFGRIINVETAEIESVAQVIVHRNEEVNAML
jgi:Ca-activated chloride channel family protein